MRKHGVSFDEAATAFEDPNHLIVDDGSGDGKTYWLLGFSIAGRLLTVVHVERGRRERIISAHGATAEDERRYRQGQDEPSASRGKRTKADRREALAEVARARLDAVRSLGFVVPRDDGGGLPPRAPRGGLWRPLELYGLMYEGPARRLLGLSREAFRWLVLPAPKVGVYDPLHARRDQPSVSRQPGRSAQCRAFVSRRREQIDADVRVEHEEFMTRARSWLAAATRAGGGTALGAGGRDEDGQRTR